MHKNAEFVLFAVIAAMACQLYFIYSKLDRANTDLSNFQSQMDQYHFKMQDVEKGSESLQPLKDAMKKIESKVNAEVSSHPDIDALKSQVNALAKKQETVATTAAVAVDQNLKNQLEIAKIDHEKLETFLSMKQIPASIRNWYAYSETEAAKLDALEGDNPEVLNYIKKFRIIPPPPPSTRTVLPPRDMSRGNGPQLLHIFQNKTDGFFVECGAFDGLALSNTFLLERQLKWTGLLVEAEPLNFEMAFDKKRNVFLVPGCLSLSTKTKLSKFSFGDHVYAHIDESNALQSAVSVHCIPLHSILLALNKTTIDLFSLDIEGHELSVLKTIPFDKINIKVLIVEFSHIKEGKKALEDFMAAKGYIIYPSTAEEQKIQNWAGEDYIFIKKGCGYKETRRP